MSDPKSQEILRKIFEHALNTPMDESNPTSGHVIDDEDLLLDWSTGDLTDEQHKAILDHLAGCPPCRREIAKMVQAGALVLSEAEEAATETATTETRLPAEGPRVASSRPAAKRSRGPMFVVLAVAAALLIAFVWGNYDGRGSDAGRMLAMAQKELESGRPEHAFDQMSQLLKGAAALTDTQRSQASQLLEESGYQTALSRLSSQDFSRVSDIEGQVARHAAASARLLNLRIQAERGETKEHSLAGKTSLIRDYGYERDGQRVIKDFTFPQITSTVKRLTEELRVAVAEHPDALDLRLNFGQFLLEQSDFAGAAEQFAEAVQIHPSSALAETGLGLALFRQEKPETINEALGHFQRAVELEPDDREANENLAVCLMRLGRQDKAQEYYKKAQQL